ncbi:HAD family acid phosphatase [Streptomyces albidus (ex Kaewkla and Franco 2022)]|uniref:HAD family acid phosphatase n=1 Tax=Streptomyces albidus (ex Kaewkla and Franco 2022) TaxID=722709 RepID=UPI0015EF51A1|nr:HAD family acid phosphatase [Streptomyces albidus (ex Kaewkla and Franco 2022)]
MSPNDERSTRTLHSLLNSRRARVASLGVVAALAGTALFGVGQATAEHQPASGSSAPRTSDRDIPNIDKVKEKIAEYYGDIETPDGEHYASPKSDYAHQVRGIAADAQRDLKKALAKEDEKARHGDKPAIVVDVDDTTLLTYNFERQIGYNFDPKVQDEYLRTTDMDAVFGMKKLVNWADKSGITVFFLTGRAEHQRDWSVRNLENVGYKAPVDKKHFYLKDKENPPPYLECGSDCTTIEYKSGTRKHIESEGFKILGNFGDQFSDLKGGHAERRYKMPNPMYFLP